MYFSWCSKTDCFIHIRCVVLLCICIFFSNSISLPISIFPMFGEWGKLGNYTHAIRNITVLYHWESSCLLQAPTSWCLFMSWIILNFSLFYRKICSGLLLHKSNIVVSWEGLFVISFYYVQPNALPPCTIIEETLLSCTPECVTYNKSSKKSLRVMWEKLVWLRLH